MLRVLAVFLLFQISTEESTGLADCGDPVLHLLRRTREADIEDAISLASSLIRLADEKVLSYPYRDVPICWRRLYTDAALLEAVARARRAASESVAKATQDAMTAIERLDMALVVAGAPGPERPRFIHSLIAYLQANFCRAFAEKRPFKRKRLAEPSLLGAPPVYNPIPRFSSPPPLDDYLRKHLTLPFIVTGGASAWPAMTDRPWSSLSYLSELAGPGRVVPVEIGGTYTQSTWSQRIMSFSDFLYRIGLAHTPSSASESKEELLYLAQHDLFRQLPQLEDDILIPDYLYTAPPAPADLPDYAPPATETGYSLNAWLGPAGTMSPAHTDPYYNCFGASLFLPGSWLSSRSPGRGQEVDLGRPSFRHARHVRLW